ncbi:MAG: hypothetical protein K0R88_1199 [Solirubrobacterales bacterium]|jgi:hypothetical protein|nr:hypothetical protein [Solirubrobacterales bacterium]
MYREQVERPSFELQTLRNLAESRIQCQDGETVECVIQRVPIEEEV